MRVEDERVDLVAEERHLGSEREDVLDRPVVQVEADAHQALLAGPHEKALALGGALEKELALVDGRHRDGGRPSRYASAWETGSDTRATIGRARVAEAPDESGAERAASEQAQRGAAPQRIPGCRAGAAALGELAERQHRHEVPVVRPPQGRLARDPELHEQAKLDLAGDERRQLDQEGARGRRAVKIEAGCLDRLSSHLRERLRRRPSRRRRSARPRRRAATTALATYTPDGEPVGGVVRRRRRRTATSRDAVRRLEERMDAGRASRPRSARCALSRRDGPRRSAVDAAATAARAARTWSCATGRHHPPANAAARPCRGHSAKWSASTGSTCLSAPFVHPVGDDPFCTSPRAVAYTALRSIASSIAATTPSCRPISRRPASPPGARSRRVSPRRGRRSPRPARARHVRQPQPLRDAVAGVDHDDVGRLAAGRFGDLTGRDARDDVDPLAVEEEPHELDDTAGRCSPSTTAPRRSTSRPVDGRSGPSRPSARGGPRDPITEREPSSLALAGARARRPRARRGTTPS